MADFTITSPDIAEARVKLLHDSNFVRELTPIIRTCRRQMYVTTFKMEPKEKSSARNVNKILELFFNAKDRGVDVRCMFNFNINGKGTASINWYAAKYLYRHGILAKYVESARTLHAKIITVDDRFLIIGSHNLSVLSLSKNIELSVILESKDLTRSVSKYLSSLWETAIPFPVTKSKGFYDLRG